MPSDKRELTIACDTCSAAGVVPDGANPGMGIVCVGCAGQGFRKLAYEAFRGRLSIKGIQRVRRSGQGLTAFSPNLSPDVGVTYADFLKGKMP